MSEPSTPQLVQRKRRNSVETKARIVAAAQRIFASKGYAQTRLRDIANEAGVAVSLVAQHFGTKAELFETSFLAAMAASRAMEAPRDELGRAMIDYMSGGGDITLPAMVILSISDPVAQEITTKLLRERIITGLADQLGPPDAEERAIEITMLATGFLIYVRQLSAGEPSERTKASFAQMLQAIVDEGVK